MYSCKGRDKHTTSVFSTVAACKKSITCSCGKKATRDFVAEHDGFAHRPGNWPMRSEALACHPDDVRAATQSASKAGVPTEFDSKTGAPIFTGAKHRKRYCEAFGFFDRNAGYSDPRRGLKGKHDVDPDEY